MIVSAYDSLANVLYLLQELECDERLMNAQHVEDRTSLSVALRRRERDGCRAAFKTRSGCQYIKRDRGLLDAAATGAIQSAELLLEFGADHVQLKS